MRDNIVQYVKTIADGLKTYCPSCADTKPVWVGITEGHEKLSCCCACQRIHKREPVKYAE